MAPRRFLSNLRGALQGAPEAKSLHYARPALNGVMRGGAILGADRAAGWDMDAVIAEGYERSVWVYRCVELYSQSQSRLPFRIGRNVGEDDAEVLDDHPLYRVLNRRANPLETGKQLRKRLSAQVLLSKRGAFIEVTKSRAGTITRLDLLPPDRVIPVPSDNGDYLKHFEYTRYDGVVREIDPERIRWVREPHPTDPYCGITPLDAAGMSVELDQLSRLYNVSFIQNDSRPGGILAVDTDTLRDNEMDRLERRFKPGAYGAGEMAVVASGRGGLNYVDTTTRPRDMAYSEASQNAKTEILTAFGVGESLLGNASGRTFDNAEQEEYNFWTKPMPPHLDLIAGAFMDDLDGDWEPFLDTSKVEALEVGARRRRTEAREEYDKGLRSIDEYRPLSNLDPVNTPQSRALWISPAKAPVPTTPEDEAALLGPEGNGDGGGAPVDPQAPTGGGEDAADLVAEARQEPSDDMPPAGPAAALVDDARLLSQVVPEDGDAAAMLDEARDATRQARTARVVSTVSTALAAQEGKALDPQAPTEVVYQASPMETAAAEAALTAALLAYLERQRGVLVARLSSPKNRKGTRFWRADGPLDTRGGQEPLDVAKIIGAEQWVDELNAVTSEPVQQASVGASAGLLAALVAAQALPALDGPERVAASMTRMVSLDAIGGLVDAMLGFLDGLRARLAAEAEVAPAITDVIAAAEDYYDRKASTWVQAVGGDVAHSIVEGALAATAADLSIASPGGGIVRVWETAGDTRVRTTHHAIEGETRRIGEPFQVGTERLMYPQDPTASPHERYGCRCRLRYRIAVSSRLQVPQEAPVLAGV